MIEKIYHTVKKAIRREQLADPFTISMYRFSPYHACEHGCSYCDGRAEKYYVDGVFDRDIIIRENEPELLELELPKLRERAPIGIGSGVTDVYQPVEVNERLMRRCGNILADYDFPVHILTKSSLIIRDLDIWKQVNERSGFMVSVSLTFADDDVRRIFEPGASSVDERIEVLKVFKEAGCSAGVLLMPLLPGITDTDENIRGLLEKLKFIDLDYIIPSYLTLRPGRQKDFFFKVLSEHYPHLLERYHYLFGKELISGRPVYSYRQSFMKEIVPLFAGINTLTPHRVYRNRMPVYNEVFILLDHMRELYQHRGVDITHLRESTERYNAWVMEEKRFFNRRRSLPSGYIDSRLFEITESGELGVILSNERLTRFLEAVILERKVFSYTELKLRNTEKS